MWVKEDLSNPKSAFINLRISSQIEKATHIMRRFITSLIMPYTFKIVDFGY